MKGVFYIKKKLIELARLDLRGFTSYGFGVVLSGILIFLADLFFALALQRFLASIGLIQSLTNTRFLGNLGTPSTEALTLFVAVIVRAGVVSINGVLSGFGFARFERVVRQIISGQVFSRPSKSSSEISHIFNEVANGCSNFVSSVFVFGGRVTVVLALLSGLFFYSIPLTLLVIFLTLTVIPIQRFLNQNISKVSKAILSNFEKSSSTLLTGVKNFTFLKIHQLDLEQERLLMERLYQINNLRRRFYTYSSTRVAIPQIVGILAIILISGTPLTESFDNRSEIVPFLYLLLRFFTSVSDIFRTTSLLRLDFPRVVQFLSWHKSFSRTEFNRVKMSSKFSSQPPGFVVEKVSFKWEQSGNLITYPNFILEPGTINHFRGRTGVGKSTLLLLITGVLIPKSGRIEVFYEKKFTETNDKEGGLAPARLERDFQVSYLSSETVMIAGSVRENLLYGSNSEYSVQDLCDVLVNVGLVNSTGVNEFLDLRISESARELSMGQRQKLAIARAMLINPTLLILDEAATNLDTESREQLINWVKSVKGKTTILLVDHNPLPQSFVDSVINLDNS